MLHDVMKLHSEREIALPWNLALCLESYLVDKKTGNVTLNIRDGQILGFKAEEQFKV